MLQPEIAQVFGHLQAVVLQRLYYLQLHFGGPKGVKTSGTHLARQVGCSKRHLWRVLRQLQNCGAIDMRQSDGRGSFSIYTVNVGQVRALVARAEGPKLIPLGDDNMSPPSDNMAP